MHGPAATVWRPYHVSVFCQESVFRRTTFPPGRSSPGPLPPLPPPSNLVHGVMMTSGALPSSPQADQADVHHQSGGRGKANLRPPRNSQLPTLHDSLGTPPPDVHLSRDPRSAGRAPEPAPLDSRATSFSPLPQVMASITRPGPVGPDQRRSSVFGKPSESRAVSAPRFGPLTPRKKARCLRRSPGTAEGWPTTGDSAILLSPPRATSRGSRASRQQQILDPKADCRRLLTLRDGQEPHLSSETRSGCST